ncbi:hypothetical protein IE53DRAFT_317787, partial [Violaceomyces palustris]
YKIADSFVLIPHDDAVERSGKETQETEEEIARLEAKLEEMKEGMQKLKVQLYAKFGDNISEFLRSRFR